MSAGNPYLGYQGDKRTPIERTVRDAIARYTAKHGRPPEIAMVHPTHALSQADFRDVKLVEDTDVPVGTCYVGIGEWS